MANFVIPSVFTAVDKIAGPVAKMKATVGGFSDYAQTKFSKATRVFRGIGDASDTIFNKMVGLQGVVAAAFAGGAVMKLFNEMKEIASLGDDIDVTSKKIGISAQSLQELQFAAKRQNVENETLVGSLEKVNKNLGDLHNNQGALYTKLKKSNPALVRQLKHVKSTEEGFNMLLAQVDKLPNQMQKASLAQAAFGKSGQAMLNLITDGIPGLKSLREEAKKYGGILSSDVIAAAGKFDDANDNMEAAIFGLKTTLGSGLMPIVTSYMVKLTEWVAINRDVIKDKVAEYVQKITNALQWCAENFDKIVRWTKIYIGTLIALKAISITVAFVTNGIALAMGIVKAAQISYNVVAGITMALQGKSAFYTIGMTGAYKAYRATVAVVTAAQWLWNAALSANPIGLIIIGIAALIALVVVVVKKWDSWGAAIAVFMGPLGLVISMVMSFKKNWQMVARAFKTDGILGGIKAIGKVLLDAILMPLQQILQIASKLPGKIGGWAQAGADNIERFRKSMGVNTDNEQEANRKQAWDDNNTPYPSRIVPAFNPKTAQNDAVVSQMFQMTQQQKAEITIKTDANSKAEVTKNPGKIPIKTSSNVGSFGH